MLVLYSEKCVPMFNGTVCKTFFQFFFLHCDIAIVKRIAYQLYLMNDIISEFILHNIESWRYNKREDVVCSATH